MSRAELVDDLVGGHLDEPRRRRGAQAAKERGAALSAAIDAKEAACRGRRGERILLAFLRKRFGMAYALRDLCLRVERYCAAAAASPEWCSQRAQDSKQATLHEARILLCTIASTSRVVLRSVFKIASEALELRCGPDGWSCRFGIQGPMAMKIPGSFAKRLAWRFSRQSDGASPAELCCLPTPV
eukprot:s1853_g5.t4